jgi:SAM-dependent methyltransferase
MDGVERLTEEEAGEPTLIPLTHVHRYQLAAELCAGRRVLDLCCGSGYGSRLLAETALEVTGIDVHRPSIEQAAAAPVAGDRLRFEVAHAHEVLSRPLAERFDAIVMFEALEHLDGFDAAVEALRGFADGGMLVCVSLPNSRTFSEENPHDVSEFDYEQAVEVFGRIGISQTLHQFHAQGSLIRGAEDGPLAGGSTLADRAEIEHCNHMIGIANPPAGFDGSHAWARLRLAVAPAFNTYMLELERANTRLWRTNQQLARGYLGTADSAAATTLARIRSRAELAEAPAQPPLAARIGASLRRAVALLLPHGLVVLRDRLRNQHRG